jgi:uncharacterized protein (TIRG00374 family)
MAKISWPKQLKRVLMLLVLALIVQVLVLPQLAGSRKALETLGDVDWWYLLGGVVLEAGAILAYAGLTRTLTSVSFTRAAQITLASTGVSHVVPGGGVASMSVGYRLLTRSGVRGEDAGFALATQGLGSAVVLNAILWLALVITIPISGFDPVYGTAAIVGAALIALVAAAVLLLTRGRDATARFVVRLASKVPFVDEDRIHDAMYRIADRLTVLLSDRRLLLRAGAWATLNWLLDAASLWVFVAAFGVEMSINGLLIAFGIAYVLAALPITPGGLGVVEAVLTTMLVAFGAPRAEALLGVVTYRLINFWLPIPLGALAYLTLHLDRSFRDEVAEVAAEAATDQGSTT